MKFLILALALLAAPAIAQSVPGTIVLNWTNPTTGCTQGVTPCDHVPLTGTTALTGIEVYLSTTPIPDNSTAAPTVVVATGTTATQTMAVTNGQTIYARLKSRTAGSSSVFSNQVSKLITFPVSPNMPTSVTLTLTIS